MFVSIYYKPSLFNAHTMILIVHIFMNVNKLCLKNKLKNKGCERQATCDGRLARQCPVGLLASTRARQHNTATRVFEDRRLTESIQRDRPLTISSMALH